MLPSCRTAARACLGLVVVPFAFRFSLPEVLAAPLNSLSTLRAAFLGFGAPSPLSSPRAAHICPARLPCCASSPLVAGPRLSAGFVFAPPRCAGKQGLTASPCLICLRFVHSTCALRSALSAEAAARLLSLEWSKRSPMGSAKHDRSRTSALTSHLYAMKPVNLIDPE